MGNFVLLEVPSISNDAVAKFFQVLPEVSDVVRKVTSERKVIEPKL